MNYKKVYQEFFGYCDDDVVLCEICGAAAVDIHHIFYKQQGGKNNIENLIGLCRSCHDRAHFKKTPFIYPLELEKRHAEVMEIRKQNLF